MRGRGGNIGRGVRRTGPAAVAAPSRLRLARRNRRAQRRIFKEGGVVHVRRWLVPHYTKGPKQRLCCNRCLRRTGSLSRLSRASATSRDHTTARHPPSAHCASRARAQRLDSREAAAASPTVPGSPSREALPAAEGRGERPGSNPVVSCLFTLNFIFARHTHQEWLASCLSAPLCSCRREDGWQERGQAARRSGAQGPRQ
jgi:hypothetical protein